LTLGFGETGFGETGFREIVGNHSSLHQVSCDLSPLPTECPYESVDLPPEFTVYPEEVYNALSRINTRKSPGPDDIPNWLLKDFAFAIADPVCHIFNASLISGLVPDIWKRANVVPIPKSHPPKSIHEDLRPISLTSTLSKLLEAILGRRLLPIIADKFDHRQFGVLRGRSTTHALIAITSQWHQALDE
jgi:Reverse transcriptase (RNA-dependent DNA polymerase)